MRIRSLFSWRGVVLALAGAGLLSAIPAGPLEAQTARPLVTDVTFEGNETFPSDSLEIAIVTRQTDCRSFFLKPFCWFGADFAVEEAFLQPREVPRDQLRLRIWYQRRGFREATVDTTLTRDEDGVSVLFTIHEGRPVLVDTIAYEGDEAVLTEDLLSDLPLRTGDRLSTPVMDATTDTLEQRLKNRGYASAEVLRSSFRPTDSYEAEVTFEIFPGPRARYGHIAVEGNDRLSEGTVLRTLQFRTGDLYREDQLLEAQGRLFGLGIVTSASVTADLEEGPDSVVPVNVTIREGDPRRVRAGAGWTSEECLNVDARWVSRNFLGGGRRLQVRGRLSNLGTQQFGDVLCPESGEGPFAKLNWIVSADFDQPWIFSTRNSFQASVFGERQSVKDVFVRQAVGLNLRLTRAIGPRTPLTASYTPELSRLDAAEILFCTSFLVCRPQDVDVLQGANWLAPVGLSFTRNVTDNVLNPASGYAVFLDLEHAASWTGSNYRYDRLIAEGSWYERVTDGGGVLAAGARVGWVGSGGFDQLVAGTDAAEIVHPQKRFYAGGANSVRGFAQNRLGPRVLTVPVQTLLEADPAEGGCLPREIQARSCDASMLGQAGFSPRPTGGTRLVEGSVELRVPFAGQFQLAGFTDFGRLWQESFDEQSFEVTPGVGVRYLSPIGPLRVDLAYRFRGGEALQVVTSQVAAYDPAVHSEDDQILIGGNPIPYVVTDELAVLEPPVLFGADPSFWQRLQLHFSIGQAF